MNRRWVAFLLILSIGLLAWGTAQSARNTLFDNKKMQEELEILKGILKTTMQFVARDLRSAETPRRGGDFSWYSISLSAFYLHGQGATFIIPTSRLVTAFSGVRTIWYQDGQTITDNIRGAQIELEAHEAEIEAAAEAARSVNTWTQPFPPVPPAAPAPQAAPTPPAAPTAPATAARAPRPGTTEQRQEELRKRLAEAQEKIKKRREEVEQQHRKFLESLGQLKGYLIEALANHGDSLTQVKPNEYINLVLMIDDRDAGDPGEAKQDIISVQKSVISDYKAGRLTMDAFKQKVLQYSE